MPDPALLLPKLLAVADRAGAVILEHYAGDHRWPARPTARR